MLAYRVVISIKNSSECMNMVKALKNFSKLTRFLLGLVSHFDGEI